jgi:hypothetical protein
VSGALARTIRTARADRPAADVCDLCGETTEPEHPHLLDTARDHVLCACRACSLLFVRGAATPERPYRLVPRRRVRLPEVDTEPLGVPVGMAFFVPREDGAVTAFYPSPLGATRWETDSAAWRRVAGQCPELAGLRPDVEALLVNTARGLRHHWLVPIDDCYRLVAVIRAEWRGLSGGSKVWREIEQFFAELSERPD